MLLNEPCRVTLVVLNLDVKSDDNFLKTFLKRMTTKIFWTYNVDVKILCVNLHVSCLPAPGCNQKSSAEPKEARF